MGVTAGTPAASPADFDYPSRQVLECPYGFYEALREEAPVYRIPSGEYVVSRWEDIVEVSRNQEVFSTHSSWSAWRSHSRSS